MWRPDRTHPGRGRWQGILHGGRRRARGAARALAFARMNGTFPAAPQSIPGSNQRTEDRMTGVAHARQPTRYVPAMLAVASVAWAAPARGQAGPAGRPPEVHEAAISDLQAAMARGEVTAVQLVDAYVARIRAYDGQGPALNAMIRLNPRALADAEALDAERRARGPRGPLHGVPVILKDNFDTADLPTSGGSLALASAGPPDDGFVVKRLRAAGAVILGKANMHELAAGITTISSLGGQTRNAYDPRRCPGGSSGGT